MTRRRMPVNVLQARGAGGDPLLEDLVGGAAAPGDCAPPGSEAAAVSSPTEARRVREWLEDRRLRRAREAVRAGAVASVLVGLVPWPPVAVACLVAIQAALVRQLARQYGATPNRAALKAVAASVAVGAVLVTAAGIAAAVLRLVPALGAVAGVLCQGLSAAVATHVVGRVFIKHFEAGETLLDLDALSMKEYFRRKLSEDVRGVGPAGGDRR